MREIIWSTLARSQYLSALAFLADQDHARASRFLERVEATTEALSKRPIGRPGYGVGTFEKIIQKTSYVIVFELAGDELRLLRLFHLSHDWRGWKDDETPPQ